MRPGVAVVAVVCALLLFGAGFWSRSLVSDVPTPPTTLPPAPLVAPAPVAVAPAVVPAVRPPPPPTAQAVAPAPPVTPTVDNPMGLRPDDPMLNKRPLEAPPLQVPDDYQEDPNSPYAGKSRELEYAELILHERKRDPVRLKSAHDVLQRCVQQEPENERCQDDLEIAVRLLRSVGMGQRDPPPPKLDDTKMNLRKRGVSVP